jgi:hypothetical protein
MRGARDQVQAIAASHGEAKSSESQSAVIGRVCQPRREQRKYPPPLFPKCLRMDPESPHSRGRLELRPLDAKTVSMRRGLRKTGE